MSFPFAFEQGKVRSEKPEPEEATLDGSRDGRMDPKYRYIDTDENIESFDTLTKKYQYYGVFYLPEILFI